MSFLLNYLIISIEILVALCNNYMIISNTFYIGWDVGEWNCDKNPNCKDALLLLDSNGRFKKHSNE